MNIQAEREVSLAIAGHIEPIRLRELALILGADLTLAEDYNNSIGTSTPVQFLKGLHDAFNVVKPKGTFIWHGWNNKDTYSYWSATATAKAKVDALQSY